MNKLISIYTVFNKYPLDWLNQAVEGIRSQTYQNTEYIFLIYGEGNDLAGILNILNDVNVKIYYQPDIDNFISAIKFAIGKCNGDYVCRADGEDILYPNAIKEMEMFDADMVIPNHDSIDNDGGIIEYNVNGMVSNISSNCIISKRLFNVTRFHEHQSCRDGYALLKQIERSDFTLIYLGTSLFKYRKNPGSITNNVRNKEKIAFNEYLVNKMYEVEND